MNIRNKYLFTHQNIIIFASILPIIIFGILTYKNSKDERTKATIEHIQNINQQKKQLTIDYFKEVEFNINELAKTVSFLQKQATNNIINIQNLQKDHIKNYYNSIQKDILALAKKDIFQYIFSFKNRGKNIDKRYLDDIYTYKEELGIKNILMINTKGKIIYSSDQDDLINKNIVELTEPFKNRWRDLKSLKYNGKKSIHIIHYGYDKLSKSYKQFMISPFKDVKGFIAIEIKQDNIQRIIKNVSSLGDSAETYLTYKHKEKTFLASNRYIKNGKVGDEKSGKYITKGFHSFGVDVKYGSLGDIELVGYTPLKINNITMSMQTTVGYTEIISPKIKGSDYFEQFMTDYKYHNIMLVGPKGDIFYSVKKDDDYQTNILYGKYSKTNLAKAVKDIFRTKKFTLSDLDFYKASPDILAQFALLPIFNESGDIQTIAVVQLDMYELTKRLIISDDIYHTKETYIVGKDKKLRTDSVLKPDIYNILKSYKRDILIDTKAVNEVFSSGKGVSTIKDYRGVGVLSSYDTIKFSNIEWAIITEIDQAEVDSVISSLKNNIINFIIISSILALFMMLLITNSKKRQDKELEYQATHDNLTGLPNRKFVLEFLSYILANSKRLKTKGAVLFIDLDKFKIINDSYGHEAGDLVLREIASRLKKELRKDDLLSRIGGDEFILILNNFKSLNDIEVLCKKIISTISDPIKDINRSYQVSMSIGIATFPNDSDNAQELFQYADTAMFKTKDNGRNGYTYYSKEMTEQSLQISRVENELKNAIQNNELVLHYQPQIDLKTSRVIGVEALVRWNHPKDGLVMPDNFIPIAENSTLILDLGYWVTKEACKNFKQWKDDGYELEYIAVNMSTKQLQCTECIDNLKNIFLELDFKPEWIELEITENTLISNLENTLSNINSFKDIGINFSIDDFGTGYSSFSYLKSLPISTLKIDREFVKDIILDQNDRSIVTAIIAMGHTLNYTIVAEGAETKAEVELLKYLECDIIQGNYFSRPLPEKELLEYIDNFNKK